MELDTTMKELLESVERGEWKSSGGLQAGVNSLPLLRRGF